MAIVEEKKTAQEPFLKTAEEYKESLRDGRDVRYRGTAIDDVTTHFATAGGIDKIAEFYDLQFDDAGAERPDVRARRRRACDLVVPDPADEGRSALPPRGDQVRRAAVLGDARAGHRHDRHAADRDARGAAHRSSEHSPGIRGQHPDRTSSTLEENNIHLAETIVDPQGYRARRDRHAARHRAARARDGADRQGEQRGHLDQRRQGRRNRGRRSRTRSFSGASTRRSTRRASGSTCRRTPKACEHVLPARSSTGRAPTRTTTR